MAETVTNLVSPNAADVNTWASSQIGGADHPMPIVNATAQKGIDNDVNCQQLTNDNNALVSGDHYSAWTSNFAASATYDMSAADTAFFIHFRNNSPLYFTIASTSDAIWFTLYSGSGTANWARWNYGGTDEFYNGSWHILSAFGTPDVTGGTWDETDVTGAGITLESNSTGGNFGFQISVDQMIFVNGPPVFGDTGGVTLTDQISFYNLLKADSGTSYHSELVVKAGPAIEYGFGFRIEAGNFNSANDAEISTFKEADGLGYPAMPSGYFQAIFAPPASGTQVYENYTCATNSTKYDLTADASAAGCSLSFLVSSFAGVNDVVIGGVNLVMDGTVSSPATISVADGDLGLVVDSPAAPVVWGADLVAGSVLTIKTPVADALTIDFAGTDLSDIVINLPDSEEVNLVPGGAAETYVLTGMTSSGTITFDNNTASDTTASVATALTAVQKGTTTGGGTVTIAAPPIAVDFAAPNLIDDTRVRLYNVTQATEIENVVVSGGAGYTITLTRGTDYDNSDVVTLLGTYQAAGVAKQVFRASATLTTGDFTTSDSQVNWDSPGPNTLGIDGSTVAECATDYVGVEVDIDDTDNTTQKSRIAAFIVDAITTADGIRNWVDLSGNPVITYSTNTAAQIDAAVAALAVNNNKAASTLSAQDSFEFDWSDGTDRVTALVGSGVLWLTPARVLLQATGSGVTAQDKIDIAAEVMSFVTENGEQFLEAIRLIRASTAGKSDVSGATVNFRDAADSKNRIAATVDSNGQRTAIVTDAT